MPIAGKIVRRFKIASHDPYNALAILVKRLCTTYVDPKGISHQSACHLIAFDKCLGVRPIGVCGSPRQIIAKAFPSKKIYRMQLAQNNYVQVKLLVLRLPFML